MKHTDGAGRIKEARRYAEARLAYLKEAAGSPDAAVQQLVEAVRVLLDPAVKTSRDYPLALRMLPAAGPGASVSNARRRVEESFAEYVKGAKRAAR
jgi:hypothetical protein